MAVWVEPDTVKVCAADVLEARREPVAVPINTA
jgi:hypothetical protein